MALVVALQIGSGLLRSLSQAAVLAGTLVLVLMVVAFGVFAYKSLQDDGIEWPDEDEDPGAPDGVKRGNDDDEWKYY